MAIKKVVDKPKVKVVKKFPEFDSSKLYVEETGKNILFKINKMDNGSFIYDSLNDSGERCFVSSFKEVIRDGENIYILDNQEQLARFILGCREFPKVEEVEEIVGQELAEDEVSVEDVRRSKIYGYYSCTTPRRYFDSIKGFQFLGDSSTWGIESKADTLKESIIQAIDSHTVYQFDTQEEFLRWGLEKVTGIKY